MAPNTVFEDVQEIQPWFRITATMSQSTMSSPLQVEGGGVALSSLWSQDHALVFTVEH